MPKFSLLPASVHQLSSIAAITVKHFSTKLASKVTAYNYPLLARSNASDITKLLQIAPIPPFLLYNGFEKNIDAAEVL